MSFLQNYPNEDFYDNPSSINPPSFPTSYKKSKPLKRVKSRISNAIEHKYHNDNIFDLDDDDNERKNTSVNSADENIDLANVLINVSILIQVTNNTSNEKVEPIIKTVSFIVTKKMTISTIKEKAINVINDSFMKEKTNLRIVEDGEYYIMKPAKKNGYPKWDMPGYADTAQVGEMYSTNFALCWKDNPEEYSFMFEVMKRKNACQNNCRIM